MSFSMLISVNVFLFVAANDAIWVIRSLCIGDDDDECMSAETTSVHNFGSGLTEVCQARFARCRRDVHFARRPHKSEFGSILQL